MPLRWEWNTPGQSSFRRCWRKPQQLAVPAEAQAIRHRGIPARRWLHFPRRILPRALAVHFPAPFRRLPQLQDRLQGQAGVVRRAAVVAAEAEAAGKSTQDADQKTELRRVTAVTA